MDKLIYSKLGINCDKYSDYINSYNNTDKSCIHHIYLTSLFGDQYENDILYMSVKDHTRAHLYLVLDNLLNDYDSILNKNIAKIYLSLIIRYNYTKSKWFYDEDFNDFIKIYDDLIHYTHRYYMNINWNDPKFRDNWYESTWKNPDWVKMKKESSRLNYESNKDMVELMKNNSVRDSKKQSIKTSIRNFKMYFINKLIYLYDNNLEFNEFNFKNLFYKGDYKWYEMLLNKSYYLEFLGLSKNKITELIDKYNKCHDNLIDINNLEPLNIYPELTVDELDKLKSIVKTL